MKASYFSPDTQEFIYLLYRHDVQYLIVGGEAVIYYGYPRITGDVDFFFLNDSGNVHALYQALLDFWDGDIPGLNGEGDLKSQGYVIQFGVPPNRIDLLNSITGVQFGEAWEERIAESIIIHNEEVPVYFIGLKQLIENKEQVGRGKDQEDLIYLKSLTGQ